MTKVDKALVSLIQHGLASEQDLASIPYEEVVAIKSEPVPQKRFHVEKAFGVKLDQRTVTGVPHSTESRDRMGDVARLAGWKLDNYEKNPVILFGHNGTKPPIARAERVRRGQSVSGMKSLLIDERYYEEEINPEAELMWRMVAVGAMPGRSVGFIPLTKRVPETKDEREKLGLGPFGVLFETQELVESSVVPIPMNADALQGKGFTARCYELARDVVAKAVEAGTVSRADAARLADWTAITEGDAERQERERKRSSVSFAGAIKDALILTSDQTEAMACPFPPEHGYESAANNLTWTSGSVTTGTDTSPTYVFAGARTIADLASVSAERDSLRTDLTALRQQNTDLASAIRSLSQTIEGMRGARGDQGPDDRSDASVFDLTCEQLEHDRLARQAVKSAMPRLRNALLRKTARTGKE